MSTPPQPVSPVTDEPIDVSALFAGPRATRAERRERGRALRETAPLEQLAAVGDQRADPREVLAEQEHGQSSSLVALRHERMTTDPVAFLHGAAAIMARDLAAQPTSGIIVQLCGTADLANFGRFSSPARGPVFDLDRFDETLPGPFEWDVKRLAASVAVAARAAGHKKKTARKASRAAAAAYRTTMQQLAEMPTLEVWYARMDFAEMEAALRQGDKPGKKGRRKGGKSRSTVAKLTEVADGRRRFRAAPPMLAPVAKKKRADVLAELATSYAGYLDTLPPDGTALLARYAVVDVAYQAGEATAAGSRAILLLLESGDGEPLVLQLEQAGPSVLEPYLGPSRFSPAGRRVVVGRRLLQAVEDPFLGWCTAALGTGEEPVDCSVRQVRDWPGPVDTSGLAAKELMGYARLCGSVLARAHARAGDAALITGYLGDEADFESALSHFAMAYVELNRSDFTALDQTSTTRS